MKMLYSLLGFTSERVKLERLIQCSQLSVLFGYAWKVLSSLSVHVHVV